LKVKLVYHHHHHHHHHLIFSKGEEQGQGEEQDIRETSPEAEERPRCPDVEVERQARKGQRKGQARP
jgi:hypothetical protein